MLSLLCILQVLYCVVPTGISGAIGTYGSILGIFLGIGVFVSGFYESDVMANRAECLRRPGSHVQRLGSHWRVISSTLEVTEGLLLYSF